MSKYLKYFRKTGASYASNTIGGASHNNILRIPFVSLTESDAQYLLHPVSATDARINARQLLPIDTPYV